MKVTVFHCGPAANESELKAIQHLKSRLQSEAADESWVLLANLAFSVTHQLQSDEIDLVVIGPTGVRVIEVKHWADTHRANTEDEANRVTNKAKKIGTTLRRVVPMLPRVDGVILLTQDLSKVRRLAGQQVRGVRFHALNDWKAAIAFDAERVLSAHQVAQLASLLQPRSAVAIDGSLSVWLGTLTSNSKLRRSKLSIESTGETIPQGETGFTAPLRPVRQWGP